jgi:hypothetical protein
MCCPFFFRADLPVRTVRGPLRNTSPRLPHTAALGRAARKNSVAHFGNDAPKTKDQTRWVDHWAAFRRAQAVRWAQTPLTPSAIILVGTQRRRLKQPRRSGSPPGCPSRWSAATSRASRCRRRQAGRESSGRACVHASSTRNRTMSLTCLLNTELPPVCQSGRSLAGGLGGTSPALRLGRCIGSRVNELSVFPVATNTSGT